MIEAPKKYSVLGLPVHLLDDYPRWLLDRSFSGSGSHVVTINAEMAMLGEKDPEVARIIREADLVIPDGAGIVIYLKMRGRKQRRCPGIELAESLIVELGQRGEECPIAFFGGKPGITELAAEIWRKRVPELYALTNHGYLSEAESEEWLQVLKDKQPRLILVGLGVPRQEYWIREHRSLVPDAIWIGVGGSFDVWSGTKQRAPRFFRENHLEWLYRLYQEPWRWRRMLALPKFFWRSLFYS
ncbi:WecB/TagA/CpsF family glycosyltransferase [Pannus brasiliensis CCIBt3594]|uniref:WecB/TagA/CpsF family glycosyltransferase n=1 Tax=Pannus brasiliensis CCIBt3594 TaxID=1427578 RepID=A0AAW9QQ05_9CHRO